MAERSRMEWTDSTWNPGRSGTKVSPGCKHCCAEAFVERFRDVKGHPYEQEFRNSSALGKMERRFRQRRCVYRDALQFAHRPQRRIPKAQLKEANVLELSAMLRPRLPLPRYLFTPLRPHGRELGEKNPMGKSRAVRKPAGASRITGIEFTTTEAVAMSPCEPPGITRLMLGCPVSEIVSAGSFAPTYICSSRYTSSLPSFESPRPIY